MKWLIAIVLLLSIPLIAIGDEKHSDKQQKPETVDPTVKASVKKAVKGIEKINPMTPRVNEYAPAPNPGRDPKIRPVRITEKYLIRQLDQFFKRYKKAIKNDLKYPNEVVLEALRQLRKNLKKNRKYNPNQLDEFNVFIDYANGVMNAVWAVKWIEDKAKAVKGKHKLVKQTLDVLTSILKSVTPNQVAASMKLSYPGSNVVASNGAPMVFAKAIIENKPPKWTFKALSEREFVDKKKELEDNIALLKRSLTLWRVGSPEHTKSEGFIKKVEADLEALKAERR